MAIPDFLLSGGRRDIQQPVCRAPKLIGNDKGVLIDIINTRWKRQNDPCEKSAQL